jgi:hypothetical protein
MITRPEIETLSSIDTENVLLRCDLEKLSLCFFQFEQRRQPKEQQLQQQVRIKYKSHRPILAVDQREKENFS